MNIILIISIFNDAIKSIHIYLLNPWKLLRLIKEIHSENINIILVQFEVFHLDISGNDCKELQL